jgi:hypothetical protein
VVRYIALERSLTGVVWLAMPSDGELGRARAAGGPSSQPEPNGATQGAWAQTGGLPRVAAAIPGTPGEAAVTRGVQRWTGGPASTFSGT